MFKHLWVKYLWIYVLSSIVSSILSDATVHMSVYHSSK